MSDAPGFDPLRIIDSLERHRVNYVLIGVLAGVLHGTDEIADSVDICPQMKPENLDRLNEALVELGAESVPGALIAVPSRPPASVAGGG